MKTSKSSKLSAFLVIVMMMFMALCLTSCEGYTWKYHTTVEYHYEGETENHLVEHNFTISYNSSVDEISVHAFANTFNGHEVELVYVVQYITRSTYVYDLMNVPDKVVVIDKVTTKRISKTK